MPDFHRLNRSRTSEISKEELNERLREEVSRSASKNKDKPKAIVKKVKKPSGRDKKLSEKTKRQMPPQSPARKKREQELKKREKEEKKLEKRRQKHRRRHGSNIIYYIMMSIVAAIIFAILSMTVLFNCEQIIVEGETIYSDEEIIAASRLEGTENLVRLSLAGVSDRIIDALPSLDTAEVKKQFPNAVKITVTPAEPMANFYYAGRNYVISHIGRVMQIESSAADCMEVVGYQPGDSVVVGDYIKAANPEQDKIVSEISDAIEELEFDKVTKLDISDSLSIVITYDDRVFIKIGNILSLREKLSMAKEVIRGYIKPGERVTLDVTSTEHLVQRPMTTAGENVPVETTAGETEEDDGPEPWEY